MANDCRCNKTILYDVIVGVRAFVGTCNFALVSVLVIPAAVATATASPTSTSPTSTSAISGVQMIYLSVFVCNCRRRTASFALVSTASSQMLTSMSKVVP